MKNGSWRGGGKGAGAGFPSPVVCCVRDLLFPHQSSRYDGMELRVGYLAGTPHGGEGLPTWAGTAPSSQRPRLGMRGS